MIFVASRKQLLAGLMLVKGAVNNRTPKDILKCVKFTAKERVVVITATDLEIGVHHELHAVSVNEQGEVCFACKELIAALKSMSDEDVKIEVDTTLAIAKLYGTGAEFNLPYSETKEFPDVPAWTLQPCHVVPANMIHDMVEKTAPFAATEDRRYAVTGVYADLNGSVRFVSTDTKRLAVYDSPCDKQGEPKDAGAIIPTKAMELLGAACKGLDPDEIVCIAAKWNTVTPEKGEPFDRLVEFMFATARTTIYTRLVEGRFPPYKEILPKIINHRVTLPVGTLAANIKIAAQGCDEDAKRVVFAFSKDRLTLAAKSVTKGTSMATMPIAADFGMTISFDPQYVLEFLSNFGKKDDVTLELVDGSRPALWRAGNAYQYLLMPIS